MGLDLVVHSVVNGAVGWARSSAGEHYVDIVGVTGSIPVAPTIPATPHLAIVSSISFPLPIAVTAGELQTIKTRCPIKKQ